MTSANVRTPLTALAADPDFIRAALLLIFALSVRLWLLADYPFDGLYGQDSYAYYDFAAELRSALGEGRAPQSFFWPLGYPALLAVSSALFGYAPATAQTLNIALGAATAPLGYVLGRLTGISRAGSILTGLLLTVCGQLLQSSIVVMADAPALFWSMGAAVCVLIYHRSGRLTALAAATFCIALAVITRWIALALIPSLVLAALPPLRRHGAKARFVHLAISGGIMALVFLPQIAYSRVNPFPTLNHQWVEHWHPQNALRQSFVNVDGQLDYDQINLIFYAQPFYEPFYLAPLFTPLIALGVWALRQQKMLLLLFSLWALVPYLFLIGIPYQNIRFPLIVTPAVAVLCGAGGAWLWQRTHRHMALRLALIALTCTGLLWTISTARETISRFIAVHQADRATAAWIDAQLPSGATIYTFNLTLTLRHHTDLVVRDLYFETPQSLASAWQFGRDDYLAVNLWEIETQWAGREPQIAFRWLQAARGLDELGRAGRYTLFRVRG